MGLFNSSVDAFEAASTNESEDSRLCGKLIGVSDWRANLPQLLAIHSFRLATVAGKVGVSHDVVAAEARRQAIRVPLSKQTTTRLGQERIESIRADLRAGMLKNEVQKRHRASRWDILMIELDAPGINEEQRSAARSAAAVQRRVAFRQRVLDMIANDPNTSRTTISKRSPRTYHFMLARDKEWFDKTVVILRRPLRSTTDSPRPCASGEKATVLPSRTELLRLLVTHSFELATAARAMGISKIQLAAEFQKQSIQVPLSKQTATRLGQEKIESIRADLRAGLPKKEVQKKHRVSRWDIRLIELDAPGITEAHKSAAIRKRRDTHRQKLLDLLVKDHNACRSTVITELPVTYKFMLDHDKAWFQENLPHPRQGSKAITDGEELLTTGSKAAAFPNWKADLPRLLAKYSFKLGTVAYRIGVRTCTVAAEARKQGIRVPLSQRTAEKLSQEELTAIRCDLRAGLPKKEVQKKHRVSRWDILLIELDTPAAERRSTKSAAALRKRDAHRQRVLDAIVKAPGISRSRFGKTWPETHAIMKRHDWEWFDKALPRQQPWAAPRANRLDRSQLDSTLAEKLRDIVRGLKSPSHRPVRITKYGLLRRAGCKTKYDRFSTALPETDAVLREHAETRPDYLIRKIRWAVSEMATKGQIISPNILRRKAAVPGGLLRDYKQVVLETAQQLRANVDPRSFFARDT